MTTFFKLTENSFMGSIAADGEPKPSYYVLQMYRRFVGARVVDTRVESPTFNSRAIGVITAVQKAPYIDAIGILSPDRSTLSIAVVNKHFDKPITTDIETAGFRPDSTARVTVLTAPSLDANNGNDLVTFLGLGWARQAGAPSGSMFNSGKPGTVVPRDSTYRSASDRFSYAFPPRSLTIVEMKARR